MTESLNNKGSGLRRILFSALGLMLFAASGSAAAEEGERLIVFVQPGASEVDTTFRQTQLPQIEALAREMGVPVRVVDAKKGAPEEVAITPLIVFQNHRGRSIYQGRTTTLGRIQNFIRTARFVPQGKEPLERFGIPIWEKGRTRIWAPIKVSSVTGTVPDGYDDEQFRKEALESLSSGFRKFRFHDRALLSRADRGFYMDFYPWRAEDGTLFLSLALYSQFHCKAPIFEMKKPPLIGPWTDRKRLFKEAASIMEAEVERRISDPEGGDGFDELGSRVAVADWTALGFPLPAAPEQEKVSPGTDLEIPVEWTLDKPGPADPPLVQFRFPPPLDQYSGEVTGAIGEITIPKDLRISGTTGFVEIDPKSVTMGEPTLDEAIQGSLFLYSKKYPQSGFTIESVEGDGHPVAWGRLTLAGLRGTFELKGKRAPLALPVEIEPLVGSDGTPRLSIRGSFRIDLREFDIEGADGPAPAKDALLVDVNLLYRPKS